MAIEIDNLLFNIKLFEAKNGCKPNFLVMNYYTRAYLFSLDYQIEDNDYPFNFKGVRVAISDDLDDMEIEIV